MLLEGCVTLLLWLGKCFWSQEKEATLKLFSSSRSIRQVENTAEFSGLIPRQLPTAHSQKYLCLLLSVKVLLVKLGNHQCFGDRKAKEEDDGAGARYEQWVRTDLMIHLF